MEQKRRRGRFRSLWAAALALALLGSEPAMAAGGQSVSGESAPRLLVPVGRAVGIKLFSDGVMVVGFSQIPAQEGTAVPAKTCGLREGDIITHINAAEVDTIEEVQAQLEEIGGEAMSIRAMRDGKQFQVTAQAVLCSTDGTYKLGAWLRDSMAGIGTVTYYDSTTGRFGALGHGVNDVDTAQLMPLERGSILPAAVAEVKQGQRGEPGELHGSFETTTDLGTLTANTPHGIFGTLATGVDLGTQTALPVAKKSELHTGKAVIYANVDGEQVCSYEVELTKLYPKAQDGRDMTLKVTDEALLNTTGGIVQGMSGSPIIQDGKLVGAVTHVLVNDPTTGYGIFIENMLNAAG